MLLIPAIDIKDGHCVRLRQGDLTSNITVFNTDPVAQARHWVELGAERLHLVDLDAARSGKPVNLSVIRKICSEFAEDVEIEVGGGMAHAGTRRRSARPRRGLCRDRNGCRESSGIPA